ncbi:MAG TPA: hypothetical protein VHV77_13400 [Pirellulales bacterium]|jgi:hypothetical protein|nr:hypothetical protein [Pirellulales bacterium]
MSAQCYTIEFFGGPFDGDTVELSHPPAIGRVLIPMATGAAAKRKLSPGTTAPETLAAYDLQLDGDRGICRYLGPVAAEAVSDRWRGRSDLATACARERDDRQQFARALGFVSSGTLLEASLFVASYAGRKWYVTVDDSGKWWAWNDHDLHDCQSASSLDDAVRWVRREIEFPSQKVRDGS